MKLHLLSVLFLSLLLLYTPFSLAKKVGGGGGGRKPSSGSRSPTSTGYKPNKDSTSQGGHPKQQGNYPRQPGAGGSPYGGYGSQGGYGGGHGSRGGYPGTYINRNPNNKVLSPHYGGSFGYGGYAAGGGSAFSNHVKAQGFVPSDRSKGFGHSAVKAASGGALAGMAVGYGLGSFSRPHFDFRSPQEEYYYNHYMYRKHGSQSTSTNTHANTNTNSNTNINRNTNTNDYSGGNTGDNVFTEPPQSYHNYMDACMKRPDVLPAETQKPKNKTASTAAATTKTNTSTAVKSESNTTATEHSSTPTPSNPGLLNQPEDDDTVSIVEIGYPALVEQVKARRCLELYMVHYENYMRLAGGVQGLEVDFQGLLAVVTSIVLMLLNSNALMMLP